MSPSITNLQVSGHDQAASIIFAWHKLTKLNKIISFTITVQWSFSLILNKHRQACPTRVHGKLIYTLRIFYFSSNEHFLFFNPKEDYS